MPRQGKIVWACCCWIGLSNLQNAVFHDRALAWTGKRPGCGPISVVKC